MSRSQAVDAFFKTLLEKTLEVATSIILFVLIAVSAVFLGKFTHFLEGYGASELLIKILHTGEDALIIMDAAGLLTYIGKSFSKN